MIKIFTNPTTEDKFKLMEFVYKNTNSFIMNTFGYLWADRNWWQNHPIEAYMTGDVIAGIHAKAIISKKAPDDTLKTYYIVTGKAFRGQGIAKKLIHHSLFNNTHYVKNYYVNTEENSEGVQFFTKVLQQNYRIEKNEFGTFDYVFELPIKTALDRFQDDV
jgi:hypothetical protein